MLFSSDRFILFFMYIYASHKLSLFMISLFVVYISGSDCYRYYYLLLLLFFFFFFFFFFFLAIIIIIYLFIYLFIFSQIISPS